jgi:dephospho-CoA kinase
MDGHELLAVLLEAGFVRIEGEGVRLGWGWLETFLAGRPAPLRDGTSSLSAVWGPKAIIGITGNIAVGKTTVLATLDSLGAETIDADQLVHQLREPGQAGYAAIVNLLGDTILLEDGHINIRELSARAFRQPDVLRELEAIFSPLVGEEIAQLVRRSDKHVLAVEAIRLLEGRLKEVVDRIWVVDAPREHQLARLVGQRGLTVAEANARLDAQNPQAQKLSQADVVIYNTGEPQETESQVLTAWSAILEALFEAGWLSKELVARWVSRRLAQDGHGEWADGAIEALEHIATHLQAGHPLSRQRVMALLARAN